MEGSKRKLTDDPEGPKGPVDPKGPEDEDQKIKARFEELRRQGYTSSRARYIAIGSPYGNNRKGMKHWQREQKTRPR